MKGLLFDVKTEKFTEVDVKDFHEYYDLLDCRCIDICRRKIGGRYFEIVLDDEGLLKENPVISAINPMDNECVLVGNLVFYDGVDNYGDFTPITDDGVKIIKDNLLMAVYPDGVKTVINISW